MTDVSFYDIIPIFQKEEKNMAKKKVKKVSSLAALIFIATCVLLILNFVLPQLATQGSLSGIGSTEKTNHDLFELLDSTSDSEDSTVKTFAVFALVSAIIGVLGAAYGVLCVLQPKQGKYMKFVGLLVAVVAIVTFIFALVAADDNSGSLWIANVTTSIGIAPILTLVGGLGVAATPWVIK